MCAMESRGTGLKVAVLLNDDRAHFFQALDVEVDGATADGATAGHSDASCAGAGDKRTENQRAGAHGLDDLITRYGIRECAAADCRAVTAFSLAQFDSSPHGSEQPAFGFDVAHLGDVLESNLVFSKDGRSHAGQRRILCTGNVNRANQRIAAVDDELVHKEAAVSC
jgi:hypothetical protein